MNARMDTATALKVSVALTDAPRLPPRKWSFESPRQYRKRVPHAQLAHNRREILSTIKHIRLCLDWFENDFDGDWGESWWPDEMDRQLTDHRALLTKLLAERRVLLGRTG